MLTAAQNSLTQERRLTMAAKKMSKKTTKRTTKKTARKRK